MSTAKEKSDWAKPLPEGLGRGVSYYTYVYVAQGAAAGLATTTAK